MANVLEILLKAKDEASAQIRAAGQEMGGLTSRLKEHQGALLSMTVAGAAAGAALGLLAKSAADEEAGIVRLSVALRNVGVSYDSVKDSLEGVILATQRKTGIADDQQREAISRLIYVTGDYEQSLRALPAVLDLASARGMDLAQAGELVGRALTGDTEMLGRYGIELVKGASATEVLAELTKRFGGTAEEMGNTTSGAFNKLKAAIGDTMETFGKLLLPIVKKAADALRGFVEWLEKIPSWLKAVGLVLLGGVAAGGLIAGLGLLIIQAQKGMVAILALAKALGVLQAFSGPAGLAALAVGTAAAIALTKMDLFKSSTEAGKDSLRGYEKAAKDTADAVKNDLVPALEKATKEASKWQMPKLTRGPAWWEEKPALEAIGKGLATPTPAQAARERQRLILPPDLSAIYTRLAEAQASSAEAIEKEVERLDKARMAQLLGEPVLGEALERDLAEIFAKMAQYEYESSEEVASEVIRLETEKMRTLLREAEEASARELRATQTMLDWRAQYEADLALKQHEAEMVLLEEKRRKEAEVLQSMVEMWRAQIGGVAAWTPVAPPPGGLKPPEIAYTKEGKAYHVGAVPGAPSPASQEEAERLAHILGSIGINVYLDGNQISGALGKVVNIQNRVKAE